MITPSIDLTLAFCMVLGPACEQVLVSACKLDASPDAEPILPCSSLMPKSCTCIQQCKRLLCDSTTPGLTDLQGVANSTSKVALIERLSRSGS